MTAPDLATRLLLIADCKFFAFDRDEQTVRDAADLLTRHQAERETLRAALMNLSAQWQKPRRTVANPPNPYPKTYQDGFEEAQLKCAKDVLALLAKGDQ